MTNTTKTEKPSDLVDCIACNGIGAVGSPRATCSVCNGEGLLSSAAIAEHIDMPGVGDIITWKTGAGDTLGAKVEAMFATTKSNPGGVRIIEECSGTKFSMHPQDWMDRVLTGKIKLVRRAGDTEDREDSADNHRGEDGYRAE